MKYFKEIESNVSNNNALLDKVKKLAHLKSDAALSKALNVMPPVISKIRHGRLPVGATMVIAMHEVTDMSITEIKEILIEGAME